MNWKEFTMKYGGGLTKYQKRGEVQSSSLKPEQMNFKYKTAHGYKFPEYNAALIPKGTEAVQKYQKMLNETYGTFLAEDGAWGPETQKAYERFIVNKETPQPFEKTKYRPYLGEFKKMYERMPSYNYGYESLRDADPTTMGVQQGPLTQERTQQIQGLPSEQELRQSYLGKTFGGLPMFQGSDIYEGYSPNRTWLDKDPYTGYQNPREVVEKLATNPRYAYILTPKPGTTLEQNINNPVNYKDYFEFEDNDLVKIKDPQGFKNLINYVITDPKFLNTDIPYQEVTDKFKNFEEKDWSDPKKISEILYPEGDKESANFFRRNVLNSKNLKIPYTPIYWREGDAMASDFSKNPEIAQYMKEKGITLAGGYRHAAKNNLPKSTAFTSQLGESVLAQRDAAINKRPFGFAGSGWGSPVIQDPNMFNLSGYIPITEDMFYVDPRGTMQSYWDDPAKRKKYLLKAGVPEDQLDKVYINTSTFPIQEYKPRKDAQGNIYQYGGGLPIYQKKGEFNWKTYKDVGIQTLPSKSQIAAAQGQQRDNVYVNPVVKNAAQLQRINQIQEEERQRRIQETADRVRGTLRATTDADIEAQNREDYTLTGRARSLGRGDFNPLVVAAGVVDLINPASYWYAGKDFGRGVKQTGEGIVNLDPEQIGSGLLQTGLSALQLYPGASTARSVIKGAAPRLFGSTMSSQADDFLRSVRSMDDFATSQPFRYGTQIGLNAGSKIKTVNVPQTSAPNSAYQAGIVNSAPTFWSMQDVPGLHLKSTMSGSPLEKQLSKTGEININNIKAYIGKTDVGAQDKFIIQKVLNEKFPGQTKINYNDFRKKVSEELVPLERSIIEDYEHGNWGLSKLGYPTAKRSSYDFAIKNTQDQIDELEKELSGNIEPTSWQTAAQIKKGLEIQLSAARAQLAKNLDEYEKLPLENVSITYSNPTRFGTGSDDHFDQSTLGHARTLVSKEEPDVMHFLEQQSDYWQKLGRQKPIDLEKYKTDIERGEQLLARQQDSYEYDLELLNHMKKTGKNYSGHTKSDWEIKQFEDILNTRGKELKSRADKLSLMKGDITNPEQKEFLGKAHQERLLQENVRYAAEQGKSIVRFPTAETSIKIQGYTPKTLRNDLDNDIKELEFLKNDPEFAKIPDDQVLPMRDYGYRRLSETPITKSKYLELLDKEINNLKSLSDKELDAEMFSPKHQTIIRKYAEQPKTIKKLFGVEPKVVTDGKGNTWYEFDIPEKFKQGKAEIKAFALGGNLDKLDYQTGGPSIDLKLPQFEEDKPRPFFEMSGAGTGPQYDVFSHSYVPLGKNLGISADLMSFKEGDWRGGRYGISGNINIPINRGERRTRPDVKDLPIYQKRGEVSYSSVIDPKTKRINLEAFDRLQSLLKEQELIAQSRPEGAKTLPEIQIVGERPGLGSRIRNAIKPYVAPEGGFLDQWRQRIVDATGGSNWYKQPNSVLNAFSSIVTSPLQAPQYAAVYAATDGKLQTPSEALNIQNPVGAFLTDVALDPMTYIGMGVSKIPQKIGQAAIPSVKQAGKYLTTQTPLRNAYNLIPEGTFSGYSKLKNPNKSYRVAGMDAYDDFIESGVLRSKQQGVPEGATFAERIMNRPTGFPSFQKGYADLRYLPEKGGVVFETSLPTFKRGEINPVTGQLIRGRHYAHRVIDPQTGTAMGSIPGENISLYASQPHWLKGYPQLNTSNQLANSPNAINQAGIGFIDVKGAFQKYPKGPLTGEEIVAYRNSPYYQKATKEHLDMVNKYGDQWTLGNYMEDALQEAITTGTRNRVNPVLYGGRNWGTSDYVIAGIVGTAFPSVLGLHGLVWAPPAVRSKVLKNVGIQGVPGGLSSQDTTIDITNRPMSFAKVNQTADGNIIIGGEFIEDTNNTVRKAKDWLNATDTYSDKKYSSKDVQSFYGIENGKFKVGKANEFNPETEIVPRRFGAVNIDKAVLNGEEMRLLDKQGNPIYQNTPNTGKFILYSPSTGKAQFTYINTGKSGVNKVNDFLKKNKDAQYIHLDNGRYEYYGINPEGLTEQDFKNYYEQDFKREGNPGYNMILKKYGGDELDDYQYGGGFLPTRYTSNPYDPAIKYFNDSLNLYKGYVMQDYLMGPKNERISPGTRISWTPEELRKNRTKKWNPILKQKIADDFQNQEEMFASDFVNENNKKLVRYYKSLGFTDDNIMYHTSADLVHPTIRAIGTYMDGSALSPIYKKPVQPVKYANPKVVEKQKILKDAGLYTGELDGIWGSGSEKAWKEYTERNTTPTNVPVSDRTNREVTDPKVQKYLIQTYNQMSTPYKKAAVAKYGDPSKVPFQGVNIYELNPNPYMKEEGGETNLFNWNNLDQWFKNGGESDFVNNIYSDYMDGVYDGTPLEENAKKVYDKLNTIYYRQAKESGMTPPNYIMTNVIKKALKPS